MSQIMKTGPDGLRLLMDFEKGPDDGSVPLSEGGAALAPYVCPGDELTIGYGCCTWFDGEPVQIHHRLETESDALNLLMYNLTSYEDCVRGALTREATQHQFDAMVGLCFNIGKGAFLGSSVLKSFNEGRMEDAAANFGLWSGSTTGRPRREHIRNPDYEPKLKQDHKGLWRWKGPEGQYCAYMLRLQGLLYRHYAEALLFMGRDWRSTLRSSTAMELVLEPTHPSVAEWDAGKGRWLDKVKYRTPFKDVYAQAYNDRLQASPVSAAPEPAKAEAAPDTQAKATADAKAGQPPPATQPEAAGLPVNKTAPVSPGVGTGEGVSPLPSKPAPPSPNAPVPGAKEAAPAPSLPGPKPPPLLPSPAQQRDAVNATTSSGIDPSSTKSMLLSRRFWGLVMIISGRVIFALYGTDTILKLGSDPIVSELVANVMVLIASSAWEYCGEVLHTWGKVRARRALR